MSERKNLIQWVKAHKKELLIAGISVAVIVGGGWDKKPRIYPATVEVS